MNIQTLAYNVGKKANKYDIQNFLKEQFDKTEDTQTKILLAGAFNYFMPTIPAVAKDLQSWCYKAVSRDENKPFLHHAYYDGEWMVGCDSHRLHRYKPNKPDLAIGCYDAGLNKIGIDSHFPDTKPLFRGFYEGDTFSMDKIIMVSEQTACVKLYECDWLFNINYLRAAMNGLKECEVFGDKSRGRERSMGSLLFKFSDREAMVMARNVP